MRSLVNYEHVHTVHTAMRSLAFAGLLWAYRHCKDEKF